MERLSRCRTGHVHGQVSRAAARRSAAPVAKHQGQVDASTPNTGAAMIDQAAAKPAKAVPGLAGQQLEHQERIGQDRTPAEPGTRFIASAMVHA